MLRITVELLPGGDERCKKVLGTGYIVNDASGTPTRGNYRALFKRQRPPVVIAEVKDFPRKRLGPWDLLYRALREVVGDRNGSH